MKLTSITIKNFRSITRAYKVPLRELTVLVGPNNEGKSNVLAALVLALKVLSEGKYTTRRTRLRYRYSDGLDGYVWQRDYPISLQPGNSEGTSEIVLEFSLSPAELAKFKKRTSVNLNSDLKIRIGFGPQVANVGLVLQGPLKKKITQSHIVAIGSFVADMMLLQYIPAIRTAEITERAIDELLSKQLQTLESNPDYQTYIAKIEAIQRPILDSLARDITDTVQKFLPDVKSITLTTERSLARAISRAASIVVDDGNQTSIHSKGDGVKSLTAISLMKHISQAALNARSLILAIEEPESHLHPKAIHRFRDVLHDMAKEGQVILTTHAAPLVDREHPDHNIIVRGGAATPADSLTAVREALGVQQADNLTSARLILLVEGDEDARVLHAWLPRLSAKISRALRTGELAIDTLSGASNLAYKARLHKANICEVHAFLDNDDAGRKAIEKAQDSNSLLPSEYTATVCPGCQNSELEDTISASCYLDNINAKFGLNLTANEISTGTKQAWSERVRLLFEKRGKVWSERTEKMVKDIVATDAEAAKLGSLNQKRRQPIDNLVTRLTERLGS